MSDEQIIRLFWSLVYVVVGMLGLHVLLKSISRFIKVKRDRRMAILEKELKEIDDE